MSMVDISPEALERIVRIETKLDMLVEMLPEIQRLQVAHERAEQSADFYHHFRGNCIDRKGDVIVRENKRFMEKSCRIHKWTHTERECQAIHESSLWLCHRLFNSVLCRAGRVGY